VIDPSSLDLSFWRLGCESRLRRLWRPLGHILEATNLYYAKNATRVRMETKDSMLEYCVTIQDSLRRFRLTLHDMQEVANYKGKPTVVHINIIPPLPLAVGNYMREPFTVIIPNSTMTCMAVIAPGGTVGGVFKACLAPLTIHWIPSPRTPYGLNNGRNANTFLQPKQTNMHGQEEDG
jgi:hypothetical protein